jgi:hypothetical protein
MIYFVFSAFISRPISLLASPGVLTLEIKRPESEADHSPPSSAEANNAWCSVKHRDNFTFYFNGSTR